MHLNGNLAAKMVEILLIEDNPGDIRLVKEVFKDSKLHNNLRVALDGEEAMKMLRQEGEYFKAQRPDLIILDLNLPKKNGI